MQKLASLSFAVFVLLCLAGSASALSVTPDPRSWSVGSASGTLDFIEHTVGQPSGGTDLLNTTGVDDDVLVFQVVVSTGTIASSSLSIFLNFPTAAGTVSGTGDVAVSSASGTSAVTFGYQGGSLGPSQSSDYVYVAWDAVSAGQSVTFEPDTGEIATFTVDVVPEPATLMLLGGGLSALGALGRRRGRL